MKTRISKAYRGKDHVGWKKTVAGREWFLGYGTDPAHEARAISLAEVLDAKWRLIRATGGAELSETDFEESKAIIAGQPRWASARRETPPPVLSVGFAPASGVANAGSISPALQPVAA
jgi:hypothetical protein